MIIAHFLIMLNHQDLTCFMSLFMRFLCSQPIKLSSNNHHLVFNHIISSHPGMYSSSCHIHMQYEEPKQEEFQSVQPWKPQFCNQWQQGIASSDFQEMTSQVAQMVAAINQLARKTEEEKEATVNEAPLGAASALEFQADHNLNNVVGGLDQVFSVPDIPIHVPEFQVDINAFDLLQLETIKPVLDLDISVWMSAHTHNLNSAFSIEYIDIPYAVSELCADFNIIPVDNSFTVGVHLAADLIDASEVIFEEPVQVDSKLELPSCLGEN
ncbi:uncharacterized protein LOC111241684 isoform X2 [Vigna radiata var. radiata]|uniref:Uncharacterized protein LOC111241684 isoform X2 n=1 Tax=Vigna radiata var. radiata TaxID=3916 RepID=A0A3Q0F326_VIGRR|nr:uncharacterized protein LOC111241684 isoform X2 [Vigna radiata var. radiata]